MATSINIKWPLEKSSRGAFAVNEDTLEAVQDDLRILLITNHGERPIQIDFGANLRQLIFEFQGEELRQRMTDNIVAAIEKWMPFLRLIDIEIEDSTVNAGLRDNEVRLKVEFSVGNLNITKVLNQSIRA